MMPDETGVRREVDLFISYTSEDRQWAEWIAWQLEAAGYRTLLQAWDFLPGLDWVHEMQQATTAAKRTLVVLSPAYLNSLHGEAEWRVAYAHDPTGEQGRLILVRVAECVPPGLLTTRVLLDLVGLDEGRATEALIMGLEARRARPARPPRFPGESDQSPSSPDFAEVRSRTGALYGVPSHPRNFIRRQVLLDHAKAALLRQPEPSSPSPTVVGLVGMGGIGKSVIATDIARDEDVRSHFRDGVYRVSLERGSDLRASRAQLINSLGGAVTALEDEPTGRARLAELLFDRTCLIVLDNVWRADDVDAFRAMGEGSRILVTTRNAGTVEDALIIRVEPLADLQALDMLAAWSEQPVSKLAPEAVEVAQRCGNLPLALAIAGASARGSNRRWATVLRKLKDADLSALRTRMGNYPYPELLSSFDVSVEDLAPENRDRYRDLVVLGEHGWVPEGIVAKLWSESLDQSQSLDLIDDLVRRSLLQRDEETGDLKLHDLQLDYLTSNSDQTRVRLLHDQLAHSILRSWEGERGELNLGDAVRTAQDDPRAFVYGVTNIVKHLLAADRLLEARDLLMVEWTTTSPGAQLSGRSENAWYAIHDRFDDLLGYLKDIALVGDRIEELSERINSRSSDGPSIAAASYQCALLASSAISFVDLIPPEMLCTLVERHVWSPGRALGYARRIPAPVKRIIALRTLLPYLPPAERTAGIEATRAAWSQLDRHRLRTRIAPQLDDSLLRRVLLAEGHLAWGQNQEHRLTAFFLYPSLYSDAYLQEELVNALVELAVLSVEPDRSELIDIAILLSRLIAPFSAQGQGADERGISFEQLGSRVRALLTVVPHLSQADQISVLDEAATYVLEHGDFDYEYGNGMDARCDLIESLTGRKRVELLERTLDDALAVREPQSRSYALGQLVPLLSGEKAERVGLKALSDARSLQHEGRRAAALVRVIPGLPDSLIPDAEAAVGEMRQPDERGEVLMVLLRRVGELERPTLLTRALEDVRSCDSAYTRARLTVSILPFIPRTEQLELLHRALDVDSLAVGDRASTLAILAPWLPQSLIEEAFEKAADVELSDRRSEALGALYGRLPQSLAAVALSSPRIGDELEQADALLSLVGDVPDQAAQETAVTAALTRLEAVEGWHWKLVFDRVLPRIPSHFLKEMAASTTRVVNQHVRAELLLKVADRLSGSERDQLVEEARSLALSASSSSGEVWTLKQLLSRVAEDKRLQIAEDILQRIDAIVDDGSHLLGADIARAHALDEISRHLPDELIEFALDLVRTVKSAEWRLRLLIQIAPRLDAVQLGGVLANEAAVDPSQFSFEVERYSMILLVELARRLPDEKLNDVLDRIRTRRGSLRAYGLVAVGTRVSPAERILLCEEAVLCLRQADPHGIAGRVLSWIVPDLPDETLGDLLPLARALPKTGDRALAMLAIAAQMPPAERRELVLEVFGLVESVDPGWERSVILSDLSAHVSAETLSFFLRQALECGHDTAVHPSADFSEAINRLPEAVVWEAWNAARRVVEDRTRKELLTNTRLLRPLLLRIGGPGSIEQMVNSIVAAGRWWP